MMVSVGSYLLLDWGSYFYGLSLWQPPLGATMLYCIALLFGYVIAMLRGRVIFSIFGLTMLLFCVHTVPMQRSYLFGLRRGLLSKVDLNDLKSWTISQSLAYGNVRIYDAHIWEPHPAEPPEILKRYFRLPKLDYNIVIYQLPSPETRELSIGGGIGISFGPIPPPNRVWIPVKDNVYAFSPRFSPR